MTRSQHISWPMALAVVAVGVEFGVSANLLTWSGVPYVVEGGILPEKIHPGTYLLCLAFAARVAARPRPNHMVWLLAGADGKLAVYFGCLTCCLFYMLLTTGTGNVIVLIDTFLPAGLLACVLQDASTRELQLLRTMYQCGICVNAAIALGEAATHTTLVPLYLNELEYHPIDGEFRPTALYDHPLTGGVMSLMGLALAPRGRLWRLAYLTLCMAALISFGGRVAVGAAVTSAVFLAGVALMGRALRRDRRALHLVFYYGISFLACSALAVASFVAGFGERLVGHLYWDQSAQVRLAQWSLLDNLTSWQLLLGTRREDLLALLAPLWLRSGVGVIENFWLLMFVSLGAIGFLIFVAAFFSLMSWCWMCTGLRGRVLLASVLAVVSTSNSLGRKSTLLVALVAAIASLPEWRGNPIRVGERLVPPPTGAALAPAGR